MTELEELRTRVRQHKDNGTEVVYSRSKKCWFFYNGGGWMPIETTKMQEFHFKFNMYACLIFFVFICCALIKNSGA